MRFKPIPDSIRCATLEAKYLTVAKINGRYVIYVTDTSYVQDHIVIPSVQDFEYAVYESIDENV